MSRETRAARLQRVHTECLAEFDRIQGALRDERMQCLADRRFVSVAGAQWEGALGELFANKPRFEINKIAGSLTRIDSEHRNNRVTVTFVSRDGSPSDDLAEACAGIYRADEQDSVADEAYDNAFSEAVAGGFGAWRVTSEYVDEEDEDDDRQRIRFEPITDADSSVFFDLDAKRQDKADAKSCYVLVPMTLEAYRATWDDDPATWPKAVQQTYFDWNTPDVIYVAEVYLVEETTRTLRIFRSVDGSDTKYTDDELNADENALLERLEATSSREVRRKKTKVQRVHKYIMSGGGVLEDCGLIAGRCIPVVPVFGKRFFIDNLERCYGHVRLAKDAQRLKNMLTSKMAEISALSSTEKPIFTPEQIAGHQVMWSNDNITNYPYALVNPVLDKDGVQMPVGPLAYTKPPGIPPALGALQQVAEIDIKDLLGNQQDGDKIVSNISGNAIEMVQQRLDAQTFIYTDNFKKAMKRCGEVWLSMARDLYTDEGRRMKVLSASGEADSVTLGEDTITDDGVMAKDIDLDDADFDVVVDVGPSTVSKKNATVRALTGLLALIPPDDGETRTVLTAATLANMEGEGLADLRAWSRQKLLRMGVAKPTEQEQEQMAAEAQAAAGAAPDPQAQYLQSAAEEASAKAAQARATTVKTIAEAERTRAETAKTEVETLAAAKATVTTVVV